MENHLKLTYGSSIRDLSSVNSSFDRGVLRVAYAGDNRNGSSISKSSFEDAIGTIYNCPVVCNYIREDDQIGSHDVEFVTKDGRPVMVNVTQPVGVVPESANYWWELVEDVSGVHEYLCVDVLVWKRQEAYQKIKENGITDESMEIRVLDGHVKDGIYVIDRFEFLAFCLLGTAEPCYESASLELFSVKEFKDSYAKMMEDFKTCFSQVNAPGAGVVDRSNATEEGGEDQLDQKNELIAQYGLSQEDIEFDIAEMSLEELEDKLKEMTAGAENAFSLTGEQFREGLIDALRQPRIMTEWGESSQYCYCDYDAELSQVYAYDVADWRLYGFSYAVDGDVVKIDFDSKKRKKFSIVDFDEGDNDVSYGYAFKSVAEVAAEHAKFEAGESFSAEKQELEDKCTQYAATIEQNDKELTELRDFKAQVFSQERAEQEAAVFAMFEDLSGVEAFEALRDNCADMSIDEIEERCYALRGRNAVVKTQTFSKKTPVSARLPVEKNDGGANADEPYGGLFQEFPPNI